MSIPPDRREPDLIIRQGNVEARIYRINPEAIHSAFSNAFKLGFKFFKESAEWQEIVARSEAQKTVSG